jgi:hypothetical protein
MLTIVFVYVNFFHQIAERLIGIHFGPIQRIGSPILVSLFRMF